MAKAIPAFLDTISAGLVACQVIGADMTRGYLRLTVKITSTTNRIYKCGEVLENCSDIFTVPRHAVFKSRGRFFKTIGGYSWPKELSAAGIQPKAEG